MAWNRAWAVPILSAALLATAAAPARAQDLPGDVYQGETLAREVCIECHLVADDQKDIPLFSLAPTFFEVADDPAVTEMALRVFLQTPHATMPNIMLTPHETDDIIAYIMSLRQL